MKVRLELVAATPGNGHWLLIKWDDNIPIPEGYYKSIVWESRSGRKHAVAIYYGVTSYRFTAGDVAWINLNEDPPCSINLTGLHHSCVEDAIDSTHDTISWQRAILSALVHYCRDTGQALELY